MMPIKREVHETNQTSLLEPVVKEQNLDHFYFDTLIDDETEFNLTLVTMPDDYIIRLHDYLVRKESVRDAELGDEPFDPTLARLQNMLSRLENIPVVQKHLQEMTMTKEDQAVIEESARIVADKQAYQKKGPIGRAIHRFKNRREKI